MSLSRLLGATMIAGAPATSDDVRQTTAASPTSGRGLDGESRPTTAPAYAIAPGGAGGRA